MKTYVKLMAVFMAVCMALFCFSACSKDPEPEPESSEESSQESSVVESSEESIPEESEESSEESIWDPSIEEPIDEEPIDDEDEYEPDMVEIAREHIETRVAQNSNGMTSDERIVFVLSPLDLGADRTGKEDCTDLIQACLTAVSYEGGGTVYLPAGFYRVEGELQIPSGVTLRGEWMSPDEGGLGKGTILMAYANRGTSLDTDTGFISMSSAATLRNISVWYPEQSPTNPQPYPNTIKGTGHTVVMNVTLYNSYKGFYNSGCSSMLIRGFYGTILNQGIFGSEAYDIPRIEKIRIDTKYWVNSGLPNSPQTEAEISRLENYARNNVIGIKAGRQDWGYWYDIYTNNVRYACMLTDGNDSIGKLVTRNTKVGIYIEAMSYPGLSVSYSDLDASQAGIYYSSKGNETLSVSTTTFRNSDNAIRAVNAADYGISLNQCTFEDWNDNAVFMDGGHLNVSNTDFNGTANTFKVSNRVAQAVLTSNTFKGDTLFTGVGWSDTDDRITRDDNNHEIPERTDDYNYSFAPARQAATNRVFDVADYGAEPVMTISEIGSAKDSTASIQAALNAAANAGGGVVYIKGGYFRVDGGLTIPSGVELRGTFEGPHFGNGTMEGTQLLAYGGKGNANGTPLITMQKNSGATGFTVYYPEQGMSDKAVLEAEKVKAYPPTIRANEGCWIQNISLLGSYIGIDAMTYRCDDIVISDVTNAVMYKALVMGHGIDGGWVQNFHGNYSSWSSNYPMAPDGTDSGNKQEDAGTGEMVAISRSDLLQEYTRSNVTGVELGDCKNVQFFSCFNILIHTQINLIEDPYTGGSFDGTMWGFAFDGCHDGIKGESGDANLTLYESMGVFNQDDRIERGGYNVNTTEDFTGTVSVWNSDSWSPNARGIAYVKGGTVNYVQGWPWCVFRGECFEGGTLNILGTTFVANNDSRLTVQQAADKWGESVDDMLALDWVADQGAVAADDQINIPDAIYYSGSKGKVVGCMNCKQTLFVYTYEGADVEKEQVGIEFEMPTAEE